MLNEGVNSAPPFIIIQHFPQYSTAEATACPRVAPAAGWRLGEKIPAPGDGTPFGVGRLPGHGGHGGKGETRNPKAPRFQQLPKLPSAVRFCPSVPAGRRRLPVTEDFL